jgi:hypothetical protein
MSIFMAFNPDPPTVEDPCFGLVSGRQRFADDARFGHR